MGGWFFIEEKYLVAQALLYSLENSGKKSITWNKLWEYGHAVENYLLKEHPGSQARILMGSNESEELIYEYSDLFSLIDGGIALKPDINEDILIKRILRYVSVDILFALEEDKCLKTLN